MTLKGHSDVATDSWIGFFIISAEMYFLPNFPPPCVSIAAMGQCDQKIIAKSLPKLPKNDFTGKIKDYDTFTKIA